MDIFGFIDSKDVRNHLKDIGYQFNALEMSWIVFFCKKRFVKDKITAWQWIIDNMDDCEVPQRSNCEYRKSLKATLKVYIRAVQDEIDDFCTLSPRAVYRYSYYYKGDPCWTEEFDGLYSSVDNCLQDIKDFWDEEEIKGVQEIIVKKKFIDSQNEVTVRLDLTGEVLDISSNFYKSDEEIGLRCYFFEGLWFAFPVPFKKGDIVIRHCETEGAGIIAGNGPFVLEGITDIGSCSEHIRNYGDNTDMNAWGYFESDDGRVYREAMHNYFELEYYRESYDGPLGFLKTLSKFEKGSIGMRVLLEEYGRTLIIF